jgi:GT2 family glycosyltransferase
MNFTSVFIPVFNKYHLTERCLFSLLKHSVDTKEVFVIDNHSTDLTPELLRQFQPLFQKQGIRFQSITNTENLGFGRACNLGIRASTGDRIAILNNDTWLMPEWDRRLREAQDHLNAELVGPYFYEKEFNEKEILKKSLRFAKWNRGKFRKSWVPMLMYFKKSALDEVGIFDERYFVSFEELDLQVRFNQAGFKYFMVGDCFLWHFSKGTRGDPQLIPPHHELEGRRLFVDKWGFDPDELNPHARSWPNRLKKRWRRIKSGIGLF